MIYGHWKLHAANYLRAFRDNSTREGFFINELATWASERGFAHTAPYAWWDRLLREEGMVLTNGQWGNGPADTHCGGCEQRGRWIAHQLRRLANWLEAR